MAGDHIQALKDNVAEVTRLLQIHRALVGSTPGRKHKVEVLNKSGIVLLVACWEALVEDLAEAAFTALLNSASDHSVFPYEVLCLASRSLKDSADNRDVWKLAGSGWKQILVDHKETVFRQYVGKLNTPKPKQVDTLFQSLLGMPSLSSHWRWGRMSPDKVAKALEDLVELRGAIAHRVKGPRSVKKSTVEQNVRLIYRLSVITSNRVLAFVYAKTKTTPWPRYQMGKVS